MATLVTQIHASAGLTPTFASAAVGGDRFTPGDDVYLEFVNGSGGSITVTIDSKVNSNFGTDVNEVIVIGAGARAKSRCRPAQRFGSPTDGLGDITYSGVTSLTVGVFQCPRT